jgi:hypothetical protein
MSSRNLTHLILRKINTTLRISLPHQFIKEHGLSEGDHVVWIPNENGDVTLKFVRLNTIEELAAAS